MKGLFLAMGAVVVSCAVASADTVSYDQTFGPINVTEGGCVDLPQYSGGQTLVSVTLTLGASTSGGSIRWDNEAKISTDVTLGVGAEVTAVAPLALTVVTIPLQTSSATGIDADNDGAADFIGSDSFYVDSGSGSDSDSDSLNSPPDDLSAYIGTGNITVNLSSIAWTLLQTSGGYGPIDPSPGTYSGTVTITYEYVPEPATMGLLVLGGLGALLKRHRR